MFNSDQQQILDRLVRCQDHLLQENGLKTVFDGFDAFVSLFHAGVKHLDVGTADFVLHVLMLIFKIFKAKSSSDVYVGIVDFFRGVFTLSELLDKMKKIKEVAQRCAMSFTFPSVVAESGFSDSLRGVSQNMNVILSSDMVQSFKIMILNVVSLKVFDKSIGTKITSVLGPITPMSGIDLVQSMLDHTVNLLSYGERWLAGESLTSIFMVQDPVASFLASASELEIQQDLTFVGLPVEGKICRRKYMLDLKQAIDNGATIHKSLPTLAPQRRSMDLSLKKLKLAHTRMLNVMSASSRPMPYCVALVGNPGIGKGMLIDYVSRVWSHVKGNEHSEDMVYHRQATEEYWSGYEPASQPIIHYSEPGSLHREIAKMRGDPVMTEFLSVCDNTPYMCNMADIDSKGKVYAMPELVVLDTNDSEMNLDVIVNNPAAVKRRILYVVPRVKAEFRVPNTCRLDSEKSLNAGGAMLDRWLFDVFIMNPRNIKDSIKEAVATGVDIYSLTSTLTRLYKEHISTQQNRLKVAREINISDYSVESGVPTARAEEKYPWREVLCAMYTFFLSVCAVVFSYGASSFCSVIPDRFLAVLVRNSVNSRSSYEFEKACFYWKKLRLTLGYTEEYVTGKFMSISAHKVVAVVAATAIVWKSFRYLYKSFAPEMNVLAVSKKRDIHEINSFLKETEADHECVMPPPAVRRQNAPTWKYPDPVNFDPVCFNEAEKIMKTVKRNMRVCIRERQGKEFYNHALGICRDYAIVNTHFLNEIDDDGCELSVSTVGGNAINKMVVDLGMKWTTSERVSIGDDLTLIRLRGAAFRDITKFFPKKHVSPPYFFGTTGFIGTKQVSVTIGSKVSCKDPYGVPVEVNKTLDYIWSEHEPGACGSPLFVVTGKAVSIGGIHFAAASRDDVCSAESIDFDMIQKGIKYLDDNSRLEPICSEGYLRLPEGKVLDKIHPKSVLLYENIEHLNVLGSFGPRDVTMKSSLVKSKLFDKVEQITGVSPFVDGHPKFDAPPMKGGWVDGEWKAPFNNFLKKAGGCKKSLDPDTLNLTINILTQHLIEGLESKGVTSMNPVGLDVAMNGDPDNYYYRSINLSTSSGWPWSAKKRSLVEESPSEKYPDGVQPIKDLKEQVVETIRAYTNDEMARPLIGAQLKDEPRAHKKCIDKKTRVFYMSPFEFLIVSRMYLMPFYTMMVQHCDIFKSAIGINMLSSDVDEFVSELTDFSDHFMEGDYGGYDTSMPVDVGLAANTVIMNVLTHFGYSQGALKVVRGLLSDNLFPNIVMDQNLFVDPGLQISGKYGTAEDNSLRGLVLLVYFWVCRAPEDKTMDFFKYVRPMIYGDDFVGAIKAPVRTWFNNVRYQEFCESQYGIEYTNAMKTKDMVPFLKFNEISFLKRHFVWNKQMNHWTAPLEKDSLMKSIAYILPSKVVSEEDQIVQACTSCLREFILYDTPDSFDKRRYDFALALSETYGREKNVYLKVLKTYDQIHRELYPMDFDS